MRPKRDFPVVSQLSYRILSVRCPQLRRLTLRKWQYISSVGRHAQNGSPTHPKGCILAHLPQAMPVLVNLENLASAQLRVPTGKEAAQPALSAGREHGGPAGRAKACATG